ncbi:glutathione-dependent formaldehyde dehydrogenase [Blastococcus sp. MG754426]|uniref:alcohol dehydrogenase catalytic domain-containing protein n=1 Tax=unclassified Blastococcus TaxID=2619396 RepID=UPI001EF0D1D5|nr:MULTISPECIES: alcohol dehydrogenase catalytic domain-containing protein [unclassified Blastococcus]MCF6507402.1 glutathione-dependent formaldehyde dehydrogenase [Blastococcus sp. MG754426]MCF6512050.1 glutathione-dependent formaldehyde dehydrogenase [Blastococcus sp. MG754427]
MKAVVWHGVGDIRLDDVPDPTVQDPTDAIVEITASGICGTDLHFVRGTMSGMVEGTILGHEAVGVVRETGPGVRNLRAGDRVVIPSTVGCGVCSYCRAGYYAQCDNANPNGPSAGTCFFGGPQTTGPVDGLQAQYARIPFAHVGPVWLPPEVTDDQAILLSDIYPTAWFGARLAEVGPGDTVLVLGAGPVGQFAVTSAFQQGAGRVLVVDGIASRLDQARGRGAEAIDFNAEDPVAVVQELTGGIGVDRVIDAVGVDAQRPKSGPAAETAEQQAGSFDQERAQVAPEQNPQGANWVAGDAPSQAAQWAVQAVAKAGTIGIIGVYPPEMTSYPIGAAMNKNLTVKMGNCNHRRYIPHLLDLVRTGAIDPSTVLTQVEDMPSVLDAYETFDRRESGWTKAVVAP